MLRLLLPVLLLAAVAAAAAAADYSYSSRGRSQDPTVSITTYNGGRTAAPGDVIFEDNFDQLDMATWQHELTLWGGGNWEFEGYCNNRTNSYVRDGILYLRPTLTAERYSEAFLTSGTLDMNGGGPFDQCTCALSYGCVRMGTPTNLLNPVMSAAIRTPLSFSFTYGRVEVRAKMPAGDWIWPALWMLPVRDPYGNWPTSGEIDILESRGNRNLSLDGKQIGVQQMASTLHWGPDPNANRFMMTHFEAQNPAGYDADFHVYQLEWTPEHLQFSVDDTVVGTVAPPDGGFWQMGGFDQDTWRNNPWQGRPKMAPFDQPFYLKMNVAVGGTNEYFPDGAVNGNGAKPWSNTSPTGPRAFWNGRGQWLPTWQDEGTALQVDYVRVTAL